MGPFPWVGWGWGLGEIYSFLCGLVVGSNELTWLREKMRGAGRRQDYPGSEEKTMEPHRVTSRYLPHTRKLQATAKAWSMVCSVWSGNHFLAVLGGRKTALRGWSSERNFKTLINSIKSLMIPRRLEFLNEREFTQEP